MTLFGRKGNSNGLNPTQEMLQYVVPGTELILVYANGSTREVIHVGWVDTDGGLCSLSEDEKSIQPYSRYLYKSIKIPQGHKDVVKKNFKLLKGKKFERKVRTSSRSKPKDRDHVYVLAGLPNPNTGEMDLDVKKYLDGKKYPLVFLHTGRENTGRENFIINELLVGETDNWDEAVPLNRSDLLDGARRTLSRSVIMVNLYTAGLMEDPCRKRRKR